MALVSRDDVVPAARSSAGGNRDVPRNKRDQPLIKVMVPAPIKRDPDRLKEKLVAYTRMTTWIDCLDDKSTLGKWGKRMVLIGLQRLKPWELDKLIADIVEVDGDRDKLNAIAERLHKRAGGNDKADKGDWLHELSEYVDRSERLPASASDLDIADMAAYKLATIDLDVKRIEHFVVLDEYKVGGTPDRVSYYAGPDPDGREPAGHLITDLKTGRVDYGGLKMAMQLSGYSRARLYDPETGERTDLPEDLNLNWGLIINLPAGSAVCEVMWVDLSLGWDGFQLAKEVRAIRNRGRKAFRPYPSASLATTGEPEDEEDEGEGDD